MPDPDRDFIASIRARIAELHREARRLQLCALAQSTETHWRLIEAQLLLKGIDPRLQVTLLRIFERERR